MTTNLKPGDVFVVRENGGYRAWKVAENGTAYSGIGRPLVAGETVYFAVWKNGSRLESRKSYTLKDGDVTWVSSGHLTWERMREREQAYPMRQQMDAMMTFLGDLMSGKSVTLPTAPPLPSLPETEDNFVFVNRFGGKCPVWLKETN